MNKHDQLITDIPLIGRYSRHNEAADFKFRAFLKGSLELSNKELDAIVVEIGEAVWQKIDCTTCANCCKTLQIMVDDNDIRRLARYFKVTPKQFSDQHVSVAEDRSKHFKSSPCSFLNDDNRCSVYEHRPQACRDFPYLHVPNFRSRTLMMIDNQSVCPITFNVWQQLKRRLWPKK